MEVKPNVGGRCCCRKWWLGEREADNGFAGGPRPAGTVIYRRTKMGEPGPCDKERGEVMGECEGDTAREAARDADRE